MKRLWFVLTILLVGCSTLPNERLSQAKLQTEHTQRGPDLAFQVENPLKCPLRIRLYTNDSELQSKLDREIELAPLSDSSFSIRHTKDSSTLIRAKFTYGSPELPVTLDSLSLPFPKGNTYKISQGYHGNFSHQSRHSRYALDFNMKVGDTVCAAADGVVVGVIEDYTQGGRHHAFRPHANIITIYHPQMNIFTQYVHLKHLGSFVELGQTVQKHEVIGLSGKTGFAAGPHLHFVVMQANEYGLASMPVNFEEGYIGESLTKGSKVTK